MSLTPLNAISPIDGRYRSKTEELTAFFSEEALIKYRVLVEVEYFIALCEHPLKQLADFDSNLFESLRAIYKEFSSEDAKAIKQIEQTTNHDVKAVEYFIKDKFDQLNISRYKEFIHFGLTSQDINNTAIPLSIKLANEQIYIPLLALTLTLRSNKIPLRKAMWILPMPRYFRRHCHGSSPPIEPPC